MPPVGMTAATFVPAVVSLPVPYGEKKEVTEVDGELGVLARSSA